MYRLRGSGLLVVGGLFVEVPKIGEAGPSKIRGSSRMDEGREWEITPQRRVEVAMQEIEEERVRLAVRFAQLEAARDALDAREKAFRELM